ncbi:PIN domain-containing protein [Desulfonema limicola]|uniref:PIN domain-containing protein n=1 Tax=Desulfonema limicola TaxID=45656 RepID=A0A975GJ82_9BACT|nr:PIN domain-containing protein [Desulfonema limicola]QTA83264.1 PIN domain-containing protein [Desulfonema limicola]
MLTKNDIVISSQVVNEFVSVTIKKKILLPERSVYYAKEFMDIFHFSIISQKTIKHSFEIMEKYKFSNWDCLIIASALENGCTILYTEDMQHGQIIEKNLKVINPFIIEKMLL